MLGREEITNLELFVLNKLLKNYSSRLLKSISLGNTKMHNLEILYVKVQPLVSGFDETIFLNWIMFISTN